MCSWGSLQGNSSDVRDGAGPRSHLLPEVTVESVTSVKCHYQSRALAFQGGVLLIQVREKGLLV